MNARFFNDCRTLDELKKSYRRAAMLHHPDRGGDTRTMQEINDEYGWGFVKGLDRAYKEQDAEHQEWGLVLVVPKAVTDSMSDMGKPSAFGKIKRGMDEYKRAGYQDGLKFDPSSRLSAAPERVAIGGRT